MKRWSHQPSIRVHRPDPAGGYVSASLIAICLGVAALVLRSALTGVSLSPATWYLARASGLTLYLLLWLAAALGLGLTTGLFDRFGGRAVIYSLHGFATGLAYVFLGLHALSLAADQSVSFGLTDLVVPFHAPWREPWTGLGVIAGELLILIGASFSIRRWTGYRFWRALHWLTFPMYAMGLAHGLGAGTDTGALWADLLYLITALSLVWLAVYRVLRGPSRSRPAPVTEPAPLDRLGSHGLGAHPRRTPPVATDTQLQRPVTEIGPVRSASASTLSVRTNTGVRTRAATAARR